MIKTKSGVMPGHIAIVMDGNGRWAKKRFLPRVAGHRAGVETVERIVKAANEIGIRYLSLYAFSTENWKRPKEEIKGLMGRLKDYLLKKAQQLKLENVRIRFAGRRSDLSDEVLSLMDSAEDVTSECTGLQLIFCLNYGGRQEIIDAINKAIHSGHIGPITESFLEENLYLPDVPDPDLITRTSGELRLSNFWLWQSSYSEFFFTDILWPDFNRNNLIEAIKSYEGRERRYGSFTV